MKLQLSLALIALCSLSVLASDTLKVDFGGDLRLRYVGLNNMPKPSHGEGDAEQYFRVRTRLWGRAEVGQLESYLRVTNEFRHYFQRNSSKGKQRFPDVLFIDNLYLNYRDAFDLVDIKLGRQDMSFGAGRHLYEGTPADGSRSLFFDAARLTFKFEEERTLDAFALMIPREDWLPTAGHRRGAKSSGSTRSDYDLTGYNQNEWGAGLYYTDNSVKEFPWEAYYIFKLEEGKHSRVLVDGESFTSHTVGMRLVPKFTETLSGELELAAQVGDDDLFAQMAYAGLTYTPQVTCKPRLTAAVLYLSGDREGPRGDNAWHTLFSRGTPYGDIPGAMYSTYDYTNLLYPHLQLDIQPRANQSLRVQAGPMFAPVSEADGSGGTYGNYRGFYAFAKYTVELGNYFESRSLRGLKTSLLVEYLIKGDAFRNDQDDDAVYVCAELSYKF